MKKTNLAILVAILSLTVASLVAAKTNPKVLTAMFGWTETTHDFGKIKKAEPVQTTFTFTNKGDLPLIITDVKTSCGCTASDYSKDAIMPGKKGFVKATYNAANTGSFSKSVTVYSNTEEGTVLLFIKGEVVE